MQNEGVGADVSGHHQPAAIHLLTQRPDVYGQRGQIATGRDESIRQQDGAAKVQRDKTTSSWEEGKKETESTVRKKLTNLNALTQHCFLYARLGWSVLSTYQFNYWLFYL